MWVSKNTISHQLYSLLKLELRSPKDNTLQNKMPVARLERRRKKKGGVKHNWTQGALFDVTGGRKVKRGGQTWSYQMDNSNRLLISALS